MSGMTENRTAYLYELLNEEGMCIYVGTARNPEERLNAHRQYSVGLPQPFSMRIIRAYETLREAIKAESLLHRAGYNGSYRNAVTQIMESVSIDKIENAKDIDRYILDSVANGRTMADIGRELSITRQRVSQIHKRAIRRSKTKERTL